MPTSVVVRPFLRAAWRLAAVVVAVVLLVVVSVAGVRAWNAGIGLNVEFDTLPDALPDAPESPSPTAPDAPAPTPPKAGAVVPGAALTGPQNILVLGIDSRAAGGPDRTPANPPEMVTPESLRSISVVNLPAARTSVSVLSILPDTAVEVPGVGTSTPGQALASGGVAAAVEGVEELLGVRIDRVAAVDVRALEVMTEELGGLDAASLRSASPNKTARTAPSERLSGAEVRHLLSPPAGGESDADAGRPGGDRTGIQHGVVMALLAACERNGTFASLRETGELAQAMAPYIAVDEGLTVGYLSSIDLALSDLTSDVRFATLPTVPGSLVAGQAAPDATVLSAVREALASDSLAAYLRTGLRPPN